MGHTRHTKTTGTIQDSHNSMSDRFLFDGEREVWVVFGAHLGSDVDEGFLLLSGRVRRSQRRSQITLLFFAMRVLCEE